jgi:hypothetical protein
MILVIFKRKKMLKIHNFYRKYENLPKEKRFGLIDNPQEPTSLFVIFKRLAEVRAQKRFFEEEETRLLLLAEMGFNQLNNKDD